MYTSFVATWNPVGRLAVLVFVFRRSRIAQDNSGSLSRKPENYGIFYTLKSHVMFLIRSLFYTLF